jgi:uncharacterized protein YcfJ
MNQNSLVVVLVLMVTSLSADNFTITERIKVTSSIPLYSTITEDIPTEQCKDVKETVASSGSGNNDIIGAVVGGAAGGVLGNQIGGGKGKTAATVGGTILGVLAGQSIGSKYNTPTSSSYQVVRRCETVHISKTRQVVDGYTNKAILKGKEITVQSQQPLKEIPVTVSYSY